MSRIEGIGGMMIVKNERNWRNDGYQESEELEGMMAIKNERNRRNTNCQESEESKE